MVVVVDTITRRFFGEIDDLIIFRNEKPIENIVGIEKYIKLLKQKAS